MFLKFLLVTKKRKGERTSLIIYSLPHFTCQSLNPFKYQLIKSIKTSLEFIKKCLIAEFLPFCVFLRAADYFEKHQQACALD